MNATFMGGQTYGVEDLNAAVAKLVGAGVAPFTSKESYNYDDLNNLTSSVTAEGVSLNGLKVTASERIITVGEGIAYFENGVTIEIVEPEQFEYSTETVYIYAKYDIALRTATIEVSDIDYDSEDVSNYYIPLAIVSGTAVIDRRIFARAKVATFGRNAVEERKFELLDEPVPVFLTTESDLITDIDYSKENLLGKGYADNAIKEEFITAVISAIELSKYNYVICIPLTPEGVQDTEYEPMVYNLKSDRFLFSGWRYNNNAAYWRRTPFKVKIIDGTLSAIFGDKVNGVKNYAKLYGDYACYFKLIFV